MDFYPLPSSEPGGRGHTIGLTGTGAAAPTLRVGRGVAALTRTAAGVYKIRWTDDPGRLLGIVGFCFSADTPSAVKGYTVTGDTQVRSGGVYSLEISLWDSTFAAVDLAAAQYLDLKLEFSTQKAES